MNVKKSRLGSWAILLIFGIQSVSFAQSETWRYDAAGRVISRTNLRGETITYEYNLNDQLAKKAYPDGFAESYTYLPGARPRTSVTDRRGTTLYTYEPFYDKVASITYPSGDRLEYTHDNGPDGKRKGIGQSFSDQLAGAPYARSS
jgi:YD repeat-containing protein